MAMQERPCNRSGIPDGKQEFLDDAMRLAVTMGDQLYFDGDTLVWATITFDTSMLRRQPSFTVRRTSPTDLLTSIYTYFYIEELTSI